MAESLTLARPYAEALFKVSLHNGKNFIGELESLNAVCSDGAFKNLMLNPAVENKTLIGILTAALPVIPDELRSFIDILLGNSRLHLIKQVTELYSDLMNEHSGVVIVNILSAFKLTSDQTKKLNKSLEIRLKKSVKIKSSVDASLIGGLKIIMKDTVIDKSLKFQLQRLKSEIFRN